jgi:hypothetical protein
MKGKLMMTENNFIVSLKPLTTSLNMLNLQMLNVNQFLTTKPIQKCIKKQHINLIFRANFEKNLQNFYRGYTPEKKAEYNFVSALTERGDARSRSVDVEYSIIRTILIS